MKKVWKAVRQKLVVELGRCIMEAAYEQRDEMNPNFYSILASQGNIMLCKTLRLKTNRVGIHG